MKQLLFFIAFTAMVSLFSMDSERFLLPYEHLVGREAFEHESQGLELKLKTVYEYDQYSGVALISAPVFLFLLRSFTLGGLGWIEGGSAVGVIAWKILTMYRIMTVREERIVHLSSASHEEEGFEG